MDDYTWIEMMEKMQDLRLFCKLSTSRSKMSSLLTAQELDFLPESRFPKRNYALPDSAVL